MQSNLRRQNQSYQSTGLSAILLAYQRSAVGERLLCL